MPTTKFRVLIVEDLDTIRSTWRREIDEFNENPHTHFESIFASSSSEAFRVIDSTHIDCGIVDLRLPVETGQGTGATQGNSVLSEIVSKVAMPVAVVSGYPAELSGNLRSLPIKSFTKDAESYKSTLDWLSSHRELMLNLRHTQDSISREIAKMFHRSLWPRWQGAGILQDQESASTRRTSMVRQVVSHLAEHLALPSSGTPKFSPDEFYFKPSIRERLHTGDLLKLDEGTFIVLTPQCNMANEYPSFVIIAPCTEKRDWSEILNQLKHSNPDKRARGEKHLRDFANHAYAQSSHFLPPCDNEGPWLVDFKNCQTIPCNAEALKPKRFASLAPQFLPNLVQRFSSYLGRLGQPDIDVEELAKQLTKQRQG